MNTPISPVTHRIAHLRIDVLSDNALPAPWQAEHGLSLLIDTGEARVLMDTGQGAAFAHNCDLAQPDFAALDAVVLSHGHYDHGGNLAPVLAQTTAPFFSHRDVHVPRWSMHPDALPKYIGLSREANDAITALPAARRHTVGNLAPVARGVFAVSDIPRTADFEDAGAQLYLDEAGQIPDPVCDDLSLFVPTPQGHVIITGCCHAGLVNTAAHIQRHHPGPIFAIIGGFHLSAASHQRIAHTAAALKPHGVQHLVPMHCTGALAGQLLKKHLFA